MEEGEFPEACEDMVALDEKYKKVCVDSVEGEETNGKISQQCSF